MNNACTAALRLTSQSLQQSSTLPWRLPAKLMRQLSITTCCRALAGSSAPRDDQTRGRLHAWILPHQQLCGATYSFSCGTGSRRPFGTTPTPQYAKGKKPRPSPRPPSSAPPKRKPRAPAPAPGPTTAAAEPAADEISDDNDDTSMRLPSEAEEGEPSAEEIRAIFGPDIEPFDGVHVLRVLHHRRTAGTLADAGPAVREVPRLTEAQAAAALRFLRARFPVDEAAAADRWAAAEARLLEWEIAERERLRAAGERHWEFELQTEGQRRARERTPYGGEGFVDRVIRRAERREKDRAEERRKEEERRRLEQEREMEVARLEGREVRTGPVVPAWRSAELGEVRKRPAWVEYYRKKGQLTDLATAPAMSMFQRLWPSAVVTLLTLCGCHLLAQGYEPPSRSARLLPDIPPAAATCMAIIGANLLVFALWRIPPLYRFMNTYFYIVPGYPNAASLLGALSSHQVFNHMFVNLIFIWFIGTSVHDEVGRGAFLALYLSTGVVSGFASLFANVVTSNLRIISLGASGCTFGLLGADATLHKGKDFRVPFTDITLPLNRQLLLAVLIAFELINLARGGVVKKGIDHYQHLAGCAMGYLGAKHYQRMQAETKTEEARALEASDGVVETAGVVEAEDEKNVGLLGKALGWEGK